MTVFVYGTLTDPERVASVLETTPSEAVRLFVGPATLEGLHRVDGRYPTLVPGGSVGGRLLAVDDAALERLDRYEGVDNGLYVRVAVPIFDDDGDSPADSSETASLEPAPGAPADRSWVYVGDPARLAVDATWPGDGPFGDRVRRFVSRADVVIRNPE
ncbi:gamma-glutamylcyclotransferase [Natrinema saccharevitans]|uniref:Gamma-glutamylcyclotransferase n=1 Tax=Natrinema saccharevitans TaxID=301967 RepID=A0A1S8B1W0_9EURY|nr:gamma-glutamylcyclotransferase family protein [Natrinema saccharevitans]OLZ42614.1 gamma-glutamylcyclotransferase [Natrinema saccharevitans]